MKPTTLPLTRLSVSPLCLGTNQYGTTQPLEAARAILDTFFQAGGNFVDTAHSYGDWVPAGPRAASERVLGELLKGKPRSDYVLATKGCEFDYRGEVQGFRVTPEFLKKDLEESLVALQVEFIDLYWLHRDDVSRPVADIINALISHQNAGRLHYFGCSNWTVGRIREAQAYAKSLGHTGFVACQPMGGLAVPEPTALQNYSGGQHYASGFKMLHEAGLTMMPYSSQSMGFFSKVAKGGVESLNDLLKGLYATPQNLRRAELVSRLAKEHGVSLNEVVLAYEVCQPLRTIPIIGVNGPAQLRESLKALDLRLSAAELGALESA